MQTELSLRYLIHFAVAETGVLVQDACIALCG